MPRGKKTIFSYSFSCSEIKIKVYAWGIVKMKLDPKHASLDLLSMIKYIVLL